MRASAFAESGLITIQIPSSVEMLHKSCFSSYKSPTLITIESNLKLQQIDDFVFTKSCWTTIQVLHQLKCSANHVFLITNHVHQLHLNYTWITLEITSNWRICIWMELFDNNSSSCINWNAPQIMFFQLQITCINYNWIKLEIVPNSRI
jgi:hypothetical protein